MSAGEQHVICEVDGPVATLTLHRPERRNAMTAQMVIQAHDILRDLATRDDVRIVVFTGSGDQFFCPGADLGGSPSTAEVPEIWHYRVPVILREMPQVSIAAINGACAGAGFGWALGCDLRVASASARFSTASSTWAWPATWACRGPSAGSSAQPALAS